MTYESQTTLPAQLKIGDLFTYDGSFAQYVVIDEPEYDSQIVGCLLVFVAIGTGDQLRGLAVRLRRDTTCTIRGRYSCLALDEAIAVLPQARLGNVNVVNRKWASAKSHVLNDEDWDQVFAGFQPESTRDSEWRSGGVSLLRRHAEKIARGLFPRSLVVLRGLVSMDTSLSNGDPTCFQELENLGLIQRPAPPGSPGIVLSSEKHQWINLEVAPLGKAVHRAAMLITPNHPDPT